MPEKENIKKSEFIKKQTIVSNDKNIDKIYEKEKTEIFKQEKPKDEKRILDFLQNFLNQRKNLKMKLLIKNLRLQMTELLPKY